MPELKSKTVLESGKRTLAQVKNRVTSGLAGKSRQVIAITALAGVTGVGLAAAGFAHPTTPTSPAASVQADSRDAAALRADRSGRSATATAPASAAAKVDAAKKAAAAEAAKKAAAAKAAAAKAAAAKKAAAKAAPQWVLPMDGAQVTSCYGQRWGVLHAGIDFASSENTPEKAVGAGTVVAAGWNYTGYGISVVVNHGNGYLTHYAHMNKTAVKVGQKVKAGTVLGYEGSTGDSTGPHLHFEVHKGMWNQVDPAPWLRAHGLHPAC